MKKKSPFTAAYEMGYAKGRQDNIEPMLTWVGMALMSVPGIGKKRMKEAMAKFVHYVNVNYHDGNSIKEMQRLIKEYADIEIAVEIGSGLSRIERDIDCFAPLEEEKA